MAEDFKISSNVDLGEKDKTTTTTNLSQNNKKPESCLLFSFLFSQRQTMAVSPQLSNNNNKSNNKNTNKNNNNKKNISNNNGWVTVGLASSSASSTKKKTKNYTNKKPTTTTKQTNYVDFNNRHHLHLLDIIPYDVLSRGILPYLQPSDLCSLSQVSSQTRELADEGHLWKKLLQSNLIASLIRPISDSQWKMAYRLWSTGLHAEMRCGRTKKSFVEDVVGFGVDFSVNPVTKRADYVAVSQDLISYTSFARDGVRADVFGNKFKLFLPLYFSQEHFERALPLIEKTLVGLCPEKRTRHFHPNMVLDVFPKIITTFGVLLSDEGVSASRKSYDGLTRIHRLYIALAKKYPSIQKVAQRRLEKFIRSEENRTKRACPGLGQILPLLMIIDEDVFSWPKLRATFLSEQFDRSVLWSCRKYPELETTVQDNGLPETAEQCEDRVDLTLDAMRVTLRLTMFYVSFLKTTCRGTVSSRGLAYDHMFFDRPMKQRRGGANSWNATSHAVESQGEYDATAPAANAGSVWEYIVASTHHQQTQTQQQPTQPAQQQNEQPQESESSSISSSSSITTTATTATTAATAATTVMTSFRHFRDEVNYILTDGCQTWYGFFQFVGLRRPASTKSEMAALLRKHVENSRRKKYHKAGMDFSRVHASGTSHILSKGQQYRASADLKRVIFTDTWSFEGGTKYLDATCLLYKGKTLAHTVDYRRRTVEDGAVTHSGDVMSANGGSHTITIDLEQLPESITSCVFVVSAWNGATLADILSPSIAFRDAEAVERERNNTNDNNHNDTDTDNNNNSDTNTNGGQQRRRRRNNDTQQATPALCTYNLDNHDKVPHLTSVIMCKLYRVTNRLGGRSSRSSWHVLAIGDAHRGHAGAYKPIHEAAAKVV